MRCQHRITREAEFSAAHRLPGHPGPCAALHGHNWRVRLTLCRAGLDEAGMVLDFADVKRILQEVLAALDHRLLNEVPPFDRLAPTAEHLARHLAEQVAAQLAARPGAGPQGPAVHCVEVWENDRSAASYHAH